MTDAKNRPSPLSEGLCDMAPDKTMRPCDPQSFHRGVFLLATTSIPDQQAATVSNSRPKTGDNPTLTVFGELAH
jgi:hypothetical protein